MEKDHENFKAGVEGFNRQSLKKQETVEKNVLPTKEIIEEEKKAQ